MQLLNSEDWTVWDNVEPIRVRSVRTVPSTGGDAVDAPISALRRAPTVKEQAASNGVYTASDVVFLIGASQVTTGPLKPRDVVTDRDGTDFTILEAMLGANRAHWRLMTRDLVIAYQLYDTVNVEKAGVTYDASGAALRAWPSGTPSGGTTLYANLQCRVQPRESTIADERGMRGQQITYDVYLSQDLAAFDVRECRVVFGSVVLDIERYSSSESISDLARLECRLKV